MKITQIPLIAALAVTAGGCPGSSGDDRDAARVDAAGPEDSTSDASAPDCDPSVADRRRFGINIDPANPGGNPSAAELRALGARWVRIEWKAGPGYAEQDPVISELRAGGIRVLLLVDYSSVPGKPASNAGDNEWLAYNASYVAMTGELAMHYGDGVDAWQIWNEPDLSDPGGAYDPGVPAHMFGAMLRDATAAIRQHSSRPVVTGSLASGNPGYLSDAITAAGPLTTDAVAVHPYGQRAPDDWPDPNWGFGNMSNLFSAYLGFGQPLWVTEIGTIDTVNQAEYLSNVFNLAGEFGGDVPVVFWFCWSDAMVPPFGIVNADGSPKPAYANYQATAPEWDPACDEI